MTDETEAALWASIESAPEDGLRRKVLADHLEETAGTVACDCLNAEYQAGRVSLTWGGVSMAEAGMFVTFSCDRCRGTGRVSDGRAEMAEALRATASKIPYRLLTGRCVEWWWFDERNGDEIDNRTHLEGKVFDAIEVECEYMDSDMQIAFKRFDTAADATRAMLHAWIATRIKSEVPA